MVFLQKEPHEFLLGLQGPSELIESGRSFFLCSETNWTTLISSWVVFLQDFLVTVYHDNTCPFLSVRRQKNTNNGDTVTKYVLSAGENIPNFSKGQIYHGCQNRYLFEIYLFETFHQANVHNIIRNMYYQPLGCDRNGSSEILRSAKK